MDKILIACFKENVTSYYRSLMPCFLPEKISPCLTLSQMKSLLFMGTIFLLHYVSLRGLNNLKKIGFQPKKTSLLRKYCSLPTFLCPFKNTFYELEKQHIISSILFSWL